MQNLVGVGVADAAKESWIGERSLQGVILPGESLGELPEISIEDFEPAASELLERSLAAYEPERRSALRASLGEDQRAVREIECGESKLAGNFGAGGNPAQPPRDHKMD